MVNIRPAASWLHGTRRRLVLGVDVLQAGGVHDRLQNDPVLDAVDFLHLMTASRKRLGVEIREAGGRRIAATAKVAARPAGHGA